MIVKFEEQFLVRHHFFAPGSAVESLQSIELLFREGRQTLPLDVLIARHPANGSFAAESASMCPIDDPLQHAHVLAEARPQELAVGILPEPVDMIDSRGL